MNRYKLYAIIGLMAVGAIGFWTARVQAARTNWVNGSVIYSNAPAFLVINGNATTDVTTAGAALIEIAAGLSETRGIATTGSNLAATASAYVLGIATGHFYTAGTNLFIVIDGVTNKVTLTEP